MSESSAIAAGRVRVVHRTNRRFRLKLAAADRSGAQLTALQARLQATAGVTGTEMNPKTGSILVHHDVDSTLEELLDRAGLSEQLLADVVPPRFRSEVRSETSQIAQGVADRFFEADAQLARATNGWLDLKMAVPLGLLSAGVWRMLAEGVGIFEVPPYLLLWWSFDTFVKLHQPVVERTEVPADRVGRGARLRSERNAEP